MLMKLKIMFTPNGFGDYQYWQENDKKTLKRVNALIKDLSRHPDLGIGKPEKLKYSLAGLSSRRINQKDRLVYEVRDDILIIHQCRYHY